VLDPAKRVEIASRRRRPPKGRPCARPCRPRRWPRPWIRAWARNPNGWPCSRPN